MIVLMLSMALRTATPSASAETLAQTSKLLDANDIRCYGAARGRRSTPIRENYFTYSPVIDRLKRDGVFIGRRVWGENKILVYSPRAMGAIGIVRHSFTRRLPNSKCLGSVALYAPDRTQVKGWGGALAGEPTIPRPPGRARSSFACYQSRKDASLFWGARRETGGRYQSKVGVLGNDGEVVTYVGLKKVTRVGRARCPDRER